MALSGLGVSSLLPFLITITGSLYREMSGTALGIVKLAVPIGGIVIPLIVSILTREASFQVALGIFPALAAAGFVVLSTTSRRIEQRLDSRGAPARAPLRT